MALAKDIYQAFEDIVGPENISDDPALLDSYCPAVDQTSGHLGPFYRMRTPRGHAVLLPGSTEEVQAIVRICNKYNIKFKASSTFWSAMGNVSHDNAIQMDLRRMDRILEIDEKNMFAVIEPYVTSAQLQAEAMKVGLNCNIIGAGAGCSPIPGTLCHGGPGPYSMFMGTGSENALGVEWVMPNGEILRTSTLGSGDGWFCGEGPGPSLRALIRGGLGHQGGLGVFTKCAIKLSVWPGPPDFPSEGIVPAYRSVLPDNINIYTLCFPSFQALADSIYHIFENDIGYLGHRQYNMFGRDLKGAVIRILTDPKKTLNDLEALLNDPETKKQNEEMKHDYQFVLAGMTKRDMEYQEKVLDKILEETGGWKAAMTEEPDVKNWSLLYMLRLGHKNLNFIFAGGYEGAFGLGGSPDQAYGRMEEVSDFKKEWEKKGAIALSGGDSEMNSLGTQGGGGTVGLEVFTHFDSYDKESTEGCLEFFLAAAKFQKENKMGPAMQFLCSPCRGPDGYATSQEEHEKMLGPAAPLLNYQWKVKQALDPNDLGDRYYRTVEPKEK